MKLTKVPFKYVHRNVSRHGQVRYYFQKPHGKYTRLPDDPTSIEFVVRYQALMDGDRKSTPSISQPNNGSFKALCEAYKQQMMVAGLAQSTRTQQSNVLNAICNEMIGGDAARLIGNKPVKTFTLSDLEAIRARKLDKPHAANHRVKVLRKLFTYALKTNWIEDNPGVGLEKVSAKSDGHMPWTFEHVQQYMEHYEVGTMAHLCMWLLLETGFRIGDIRTVGPQHRRENEISIKTGKTNTHVTAVLSDSLTEFLDTLPRTGFTYLVTTHGKPFESPKAMSARFVKWARQAGIPAPLSAHGVRKFDAIIAAESNVNEHQLTAMFGWTNLKTAAIYTNTANRKRLARQGNEKVYGNERFRSLLDGVGVPDKNRETK